MSDSVNAAKTARELLAQALAALQSDPSVPPQLLAVAEPVSKGMGALFQIERSAGASLATQGPAALEAVRGALALLQQQPTSIPQVQLALRAVAASLSIVHELAPAARGAVAAPAAPGGPDRAWPSPAAVAGGQARTAADRAPKSAAVPQVPMTPQAQAPAVPQVPPTPSPRSAAIPQVPPTPSPRSAAIPQAPPTPRVGAIAQPPRLDAGAIQPPPAIRTAIDSSKAVRVDAALGAHSSSNFYKGLSGTDVVEHGGVFVSTYRVPSVGTPVALRISLPGGYEFDALGVVRWTREASECGEPGFGAQLVQLTAEARQLVYRYVRNREPLLYDDL